MAPNGLSTGLVDTGSPQDHRAPADAAASGGSPGAVEASLAVLFAGICGFLASGPIADNSLLTHLATGRLQVSGGLPVGNPFLAGVGEFPVPSWWWSGALGWAERLAGLGAVRLLTVVVAAGLGALVVRAGRPDGPVSGGARVPVVAPVAQALASVLVLSVLFPWLNARPHLGGFVLLAVTLVVWRERHSPWWLVPVFGIWINVHGSWLHAVVVLAVLWLGESLDSRSLDPLRLRYAAACGLGLVGGALLYPQPFALLLLPADQAGDPLARSVLRSYHEWGPASPGSPLLWTFVLLVLVALVPLLGRPRTGGSYRFGSLLVVLAATAMGFGAMRVMPVAALVLAPFAATGVLTLLDGRGPSPMARGTRWVGAACAVAGLLLGTAAVVRIQGTAHTNLARYPVDEVEWLAERDLVANDAVTVIHNDWVGNYLEYRFGEEANAWVDDRPPVRRMADYVTLRGMADGWEEVLHDVDPDVVLWQRSDPLPAELAARAQWHPALTTDRFLVLCHERIAASC